MLLDITRHRCLSIEGLPTNGCLSMSLGGHGSTVRVIVGGMDVCDSRTMHSSCDSRTEQRGKLGGMLGVVPSHVYRAFRAC